MTETSPALRAQHVWEVASRDPLRGAALAGALITDPEATYWLAVLVRERGGPLAAWLDGIDADPV